MVDWGTGHYEHVAGQIEPVAERVVQMAGLEGGERVLDVGCGTGNAALAAARAGAVVTGVDPAERLIRIAGERSAREGLEIGWALGRAEELPFGDESFDLVISIFGAIFGDSAERAIAEAIRVLRPGGEALITAWIPEGPIDALVGVVGRAVREITGGDAPGPNPWQDPRAIAEIAARHGAGCEAERALAQFTGESPESFLDLEQANHPMHLALRPALEGAGMFDRVRADALEILREANEDPDAFRVSSPYRVYRLRRGETQ